MRRAAGNAIGFLGRGSSQFTLVIGVVYMWYHHPKFALKYSECGWSDEAGSQWVDCNQEWASNFGMASLPFMTPLLVGLIGVFMYRPVLLQVQGFPRNFLQRPERCALVLSPCCEVGSVGHHGRHGHSGLGHHHWAHEWPCWTLRSRWRIPSERDRFEVAPQPIEEDDGDDYGYGDVGDDGDDGDDGDAGDDDGDTKEDETAERRLHLRQHHA
eukprot:g3386.t1